MYKNFTRKPFPIKTGIGGREFLDQNDAMQGAGSSPYQEALLKNSSVDTVSFTLPNNSRATITSVINTTPVGGRIGTIPYMIAFYEDSVASTNLIPSGSNVAVTDYLLFPTIFIPQTGIATTGDEPTGEDIVAVTTLSNVSGSDHDIVLKVQSRVITNVGSAYAGETS